MANAKAIVMLAEMNRTNGSSVTQNAANDQPEIAVRLAAAPMRENEFLPVGDFDAARSGCAVQDYAGRPI